MAIERALGGKKILVSMGGLSRRRSCLPKGCRDENDLIPTRLTASANGPEFRQLGRHGSGRGEYFVDLIHCLRHALDHAHLDELLHLLDAGES